MDMENLFNTQEYYAGQGSGHNFYARQGSGGNQEFYTGQYYSMTQGSAPVEDDSPVEEAATPVKAKKVSKYRQKIVPPKEENAMKSRGFWLKVIEYFEKETGSNRGYDSIINKWKNRVCPRIGAFCAIFDNVQRRNKSGSCDLTVYQKACVEYAAEYDHDFSLANSSLM
nr:hypothetical protein [Tanacetum cinerariifolium]